MKDENWIDMMGKHGELRLFGSLAIRKARKGAAASAQEVDMLFRVALSNQRITPHDLSQAMGASKTIVSRLIDNLTEKELIAKRFNMDDGRSYSLMVTQKGRKELDSMCYYYLGPLYDLQKNMGEDEFEELIRLIQKANQILGEKNKE